MLYLGARAAGAKVLVNDLEGAKCGIRVNSVAPTAATRMTDGEWPPEVLDAVAAEHVVPAVRYLCSEDSPNGHIIEAGDTYFARVAIVEARGVVLGPQATAEDVAARYEEIADLSGARTFDSGLVNVNAIPWRMT